MRDDSCFILCFKYNPNLDESLFLKTTHGHQNQPWSKPETIYDKNYQSKPIHSMKIPHHYQQKWIVAFSHNYWFDTLPSSLYLMLSGLFAWHPVKVGHCVTAILLPPLDSASSTA